MSFMQVFDNAQESKARQALAMRIVYYTASLMSLVSTLARPLKRVRVIFAGGRPAYPRYFDTRQCQGNRGVATLFSGWPISLQSRGR
jgi:hypothetical protein